MTRTWLQLKTAYFAVWIVGAILACCFDHEILPTGFVTDKHTRYFLSLGAIICTLSGVYVALKFFHLTTVKAAIEKASSPERCESKWHAYRLGLMALLLWGNVTVYFATLDTQGGFCALITALALVFCWPRKMSRP